MYACVRKCLLLLLGSSKQLQELTMPIVYVVILLASTTDLTSGRAGVSRMGAPILLL